MGQLGVSVNNKACDVASLLGEHDILRGAGADVKARPTAG
jgi:hypothetical protein